MQGYQVEVVNTGKNILATLSKVKPDMVFLDIGLPDMDGYAVVKLIRSNKLYKNLTVIALSGYGQLEDKMKAQAAGFTTHVTKPIGVEDIVKILKEYL